MPVQPIEDSKLMIKPSPRLTEFVTKNLKLGKAPLNITNLKNSSRTKRSEVLLTLEDVKWLDRCLKEHRKLTREKIYIHELLENADIRLPTPKITPRDPVLEERIKKLTSQQNAREYKAMTKGVDCVRKRLPEDTIAFQMKEINRQLIAVGQFVLSVLAGFAFGFIGVELMVGNLDFGFRLLLGIICALVIALAEIYFLAKKLNEDYCEEMASYAKLHQE